MPPHSMHKGAGSIVEHHRLARLFQNTLIYNPIFIEVLMAAC